MRCEPFEIEIKKLGKTIRVCERSCRCGSCETVEIKIFETDDREDCIEYNTKNEGAWYPYGCDEEYDTKSVIATCMLELAKMARVNADPCA